MSIHFQLIKRFKDLIPTLNKELHKGQNGRVGIVGGSKEYTGAPYFASMSSLRVGADLSYILTTKDAAIPLKSYSPEMIVIPILDSPNNELEIRTWISRLHSLIIGPGLGRSDVAFNSVKIALNCAKSQNIPIIIDADGLFVLSHDTSLVRGYQKCILTPNMMEFKRLYESTFQKEDEYDELKRFSTIDSQCEAVKKLAKKLENVTIVKKGKVDIISDGRDVICNESEGSLKRCGGIGDLLSGTIGTFAYWCSDDFENRINRLGVSPNPVLNNPNMIAAYASCSFIRECSKTAFDKFHRSLLAVDIIEQIGENFYQMFDK